MLLCWLVCEMTHYAEADCNQHTPLNSVRAELKGPAWLKKARIRECGRREKQHRCRRDDAEPHLSCHTSLFGPLIRKSFSPIVKPGLVARLEGLLPLPRRQSCAR